MTEGGRQPGNPRKRRDMLVGIPGCRCAHPGYDYFLTYFCTRQFSVSATKISSRGETAI